MRLTICLIEGTALSFAARNGHSQVVRALINAGANFNSTNSGGIFFKVYSRMKSNFEIIGNTALHLAAEWGYLEVIIILLDAGAEKDIQDFYGIFSNSIQNEIYCLYDRSNSSSSCSSKRSFRNCQMSN